MTNPPAKKPNLFIVGSMKSGTTSLHNYLSSHPDIFMTSWKEPGFFVKELNWDKGMDWYLALFESAKNEKYLGESSTYYTRIPNYAGVPERIHDFNPDAKIIYIMRDPIERAISGYWWEVAHSAEGRKMPTAIVNNEWIMNISNYALQIRPYLELFGPDNVFTLTMEEMQAEPEAVVKKIFAWLGVDTECNVMEEYKAYNRTANTVNRVIGSGLFSYLKGTVIWDALKAIIPDTFKSRLIAMLSKPTEKIEEGREETIALLQPIMLPQVQELSQLLGRDFPEWQTLFGKSGI